MLSFTFLKEIICLQDENRKLQQELKIAKKITEEQMTFIKVLY